MLLPFKLIFNVSLADGTRRGDCKCASVTLPAVLTPQMAWSFFAILTGMIWKISTFPIWKKARANALVLSPHLTDVSPCFAVPAQAGCQEPPEAGLEIAWSQTARGFILCVVTWTFESSTRLCNGESDSTSLDQHLHRNQLLALVSAGCSVSTFSGRAVCCWQIASWSKEVMKIFPLANMSNLSLRQCEALRESLTHPFLLLFQGKPSRTQVYAVIKMVSQRRYGFSSAFIFQVAIVYCI